MPGCIALPEYIYSDYLYSESCKFYYIQGPSGCGKTEKTLEIIKRDYGSYFDDLQFSYNNDYFYGVSGESKVALIDNFMGSIPTYHFSNIIGYNRIKVRIKAHPNCKFEGYTCIIITSVVKFDDIYDNISSSLMEKWKENIEIID
eukprot:jgi/Orpsp1_1/1178500/evm.model.c7180000065589.1